jgi:Mg2+-importing ATPase
MQLAADPRSIGDGVEKMDADQLADAAEKATLSARVSPAHKQHIIKALQSRCQRSTGPSWRPRWFATSC